MFTRRALVALALLAANAMAEDICPGISLLFKGTPESPRPGKSLKLAYTLANKSGKGIASSAVAIILDDHVHYSSSGTKPTGPAGTHANGVVTWTTAGSVAAGKSKTYTVDTAVANAAQLLTFDAAAEVVLSDGTQCVVEALSSVLRVKGFKNVVPNVETPVQQFIPYVSSLEAPTTGYAEKVLFSAEGVEVVHLCFLGQNAPANVGARDFEDDLLYTLIAARPSAITEPTLTPVDEWYGYCEGNANGQREWTLSNFNLEDIWCLGSSSSISPASFNVLNQNSYFALMNNNNGALVMNGYYCGLEMIGKVLPTDTSGWCRTAGSLTYTPSGSEFPVIL